MPKTSFRLSGDEGVGLYDPPNVSEATFRRVPESNLSKLRAVTGLTATTSDVLDELGWRLSVPATRLVPRHMGSMVIVGHALTLSYVPDRRSVEASAAQGNPPKLAHHTVYRLAQPGDVMVVEGRGLGAVSVMGGRAAAAAVNAGLSGAIVDAGVRDLNDIRRLGFPIWSRDATPITGKARAEAVAVNITVSCGDVQVQPGDIVVADDTGVCFIPNEIGPDVIRRIIEVAALEAGELLVPDRAPA